MTDVDASLPQAASRLRETERLRMFSSITRALAGDFDLAAIMQIVTDAATQWSGAKFGAFFHNITRDSGGTYSLYTLSGAPRSAFAGFPMPRKTEIFAPTFEGVGIVRSDDIRRDRRFGRNDPHFGMPQGHLPVVSYLAVPVVSRSGEIHGGLFLAHDTAGIFAEEAEETVSALAAHAAIAIDNARLLDTARREVESRRRMNEADAWLAAIIESSDDAILSKSLDGIISSWNAGAERLFGYTAQEAVGQSVTILIPEDRLHEEDEIIGRLRQGERVDHYETVRRHKNGGMLDISLTVSPVRNEQGRIIGASKIARDISDRKRAQERQALLLREMHHRVKNLFAVTSGLISLTALASSSAEEQAEALNERIQALARAHNLTQPDPDGDINEENGTTLFALISAIAEPYGFADAARLVFIGEDMPLHSSTLTSLALLLHEFTTNAAKYGSLSTQEGRIFVRTAIRGGTLLLRWTERGGPALARGEAGGDAEGFGSLLERGTIQGLEGRITREWAPAGLTIRLRLPLAPKG